MLPKALLTPRDLLSPAGSPATLEVEVERQWTPFIDPAMEGVEVEVEGAGRAFTDARGEASIPLGTPPPGDHRLRVRLPGRNGEAEAFVRVVPPETPVLIVDIDGTIADVTSVGFIFRPLRWVKPLPDAVEVLNDLSRTVAVVYLTARDHIFIRKTRIWLRLNGFPEGPIYARRRTRFWSARPRDHKIARLGELRPRFSRIVAGVGDLPGDVHAYAAHAIPPILISPRPYPGFPPGARHALSWSQIPDMINQPG